MDFHPRAAGASNRSLYAAERRNCQECPIMTCPAAPETPEIQRFSPPVPH